MLSAKEVVYTYKGVGISLVKDDDFPGVELVPFYDAEYRLVSVYALGGEFLVLEEIRSLVVEADVFAV